MRESDFSFLAIFSSHVLFQVIYQRGEFVSEFPEFIPVTLQISSFSFSISPFAFSNISFLLPLGPKQSNYNARQNPLNITIIQRTGQNLKKAPQRAATRLPEEQTRNIAFEWSVVKTNQKHRL